MLTVNVEKFGEIVVLRCMGRIVRGYETVLLCPASKQQGRTVVLDLTHVEAIDAAGIGALVSLQAAGIYLRLINPTRQVREVLKVTKLDSIFEIGESPSSGEAMGFTPRTCQTIRIRDSACLYSESKVGAAAGGSRDSLVRADEGVRPYTGGLQQR